MRAILYIRVSTMRQSDEGYSIDEQEKALLRFAMVKGYEVPDEYVIRENGRSGRYGKVRPGFDRMMEIVSAGGCDAVIVHSLSRFARSQEETVKCVRIMGEHSVDFISLKEDIDTRTAMGKAMMGVMAVFAQLYSDQLSERITEAHRYAEERGGKIGQVPYGYCLDDNGMMVEDSDEQEVIVLARSLSDDGVSYAGICEVLVDRGIPNKSGNVKWFPSQIQKMVKR